MRNDVKIINLDFSDCVKLEKTQTLEKEIEEAEAIKAADYTKESYRNLQAAIKTAKSSLIWAQTQEEIELALKTGTKYSFRIRAYKTTGGKTVYSPYSKTVSAKPVLAKE